MITYFCFKSENQCWCPLWLAGPLDENQLFSSRTCFWCGSKWPKLHCQRERRNWTGERVPLKIIITHIRIINTNNNVSIYLLTACLRFGWLTVLSSRKMVEHELYFRLCAPCCTNTQYFDANFMRLNKLRNVVRKQELETQFLWLSLFRLQSNTHAVYEEALPSVASCREAQVYPFIFQNWKLQGSVYNSWTMRINVKSWEQSASTTTRGSQSHSSRFTYRSRRPHLREEPEKTSV